MCKGIGRDKKEKKEGKQWGCEWSVAGYCRAYVLKQYVVQ